MGPPINLTGQRYSRLVVTKLLAKRTKQKQRIWECKCDCGCTTYATVCHLRSGWTKSCGCLKSEKVATTGHKNTKHGDYKTPEYKIFYGMKKRCENPKNIGYKDYGGRGIKVKFSSYEEFLTEVGRRPNHRAQINRINNNGHYEIGNVEWVTPRKNCLNRRPKNARAD